MLLREQGLGYLGYRYRQSIPQPKPTFKPSEVWTRSGVFTRSLSSFYGEKREAADAAGYEAVAIHCDGPLGEANIREAEQLAGEFKRLGWAVVGWATYGQGAEQPSDEGRRHASLTFTHGWAGFIPNGEAWAEGAEAWKTAAWMKGWLEVCVMRGVFPPLMLSCLSSTTNLWAREMDYGPFLNYPGAMISPQVYAASDPGYTLANMKQTFQVAKVPLDRLVPTFDVIGAKDMPVYPRVRPRWLWTGEDTRTSRFAQT